MEQPSWLRDEIETWALGYAVESLVPNHLQEVKSRKEELVDKTQFILAVVEVDGEKAAKTTYIMEPFGREPDFGVTSINYKLSGLLAKGEQPR